MDAGGRTVKLRLAYDGTDFHGWQRQNGLRSVQGCIEAALEKMHGHPVQLAGAGRTDSGVHAAGQAASFRSDIKNIETARFAPALNSLLPQDIRILEASPASESFHARFDAKSRTYRYHFVCGRPALVQESRYVLQVRRRPCVQTLNAYCREILGERDFSVFAAAGDSSKSASRYVSRALFFQDADTLVFEICANAFLWKMVRSITGTFLHCEEKQIPPQALREIIASGKRSLCGPTLPPRGLFLWKVDYYRD